MKRNAMLEFLQLHIGHSDFDGLNLISIGNSAAYLREKLAGTVHTGIRGCCILTRSSHDASLPETKRAGSMLHLKPRRFLSGKGGCPGLCAFRRPRGQTEPVQDNQAHWRSVPETIASKLQCFFFAMLPKTWMLDTFVCECKGLPSAGSMKWCCLKQKRFIVEVYSCKPCCWLNVPLGIWSGKTAFFLPPRNDQLKTLTSHLEAVCDLADGQNSGAKLFGTLHGAVWIHYHWPQAEPNQPCQLNN